MRGSWLAGAGLVLALGLSGVAIGGEAPNVIGKEVGKDIPDIQVNAWFGNMDGRNTIADHRGDVVVLKLWATT
jgi:hypothetical protein